jgi:hypothetical protein
MADSLPRTGAQARERYAAILALKGKAAADGR